MKRRTMLGMIVAAAIAAACQPAAPPAADESPQEVKELRLGITATEGDAARTESLESYERYLEERLGLPVTIFKASDYAGVAMAMEANQIELATVGPSNYAGMHLRMGEKVRPLVAPADGEYYSVMYVRAESPYQTIDDLRGKTLAFADVNSTSGYLTPRFLLRKEGKDPDTFFGRTLFAGGHEQGVVAVLNGQADAGVTWSSMRGDHLAGYTFGAFRLMKDSNLVDMSRLRVIWQGGPIPPGPIVANVETLGPDMVEKVTQVLLEMPQAAPDAFRLVAGGEAAGFRRVDESLYADVIAQRQAEEAARRQR